jgi:hypothetical protein
MRAHEAALVAADRALNDELVATVTKKVRHSHLTAFIQFAENSA